MFTPRPYALEGNKAPAIFAGLVLFGGYILGPALGHVIFRLTTAVDDNLAPFPTEGDTP